MKKTECGLDAKWQEADCVRIQVFFPPTHWPFHFPAESVWASFTAAARGRRDWLCAEAPSRQGLMLLCSADLPHLSLLRLLNVPPNLPWLLHLQQPALFKGGSPLFTHSSRNWIWKLAAPPGRESKHFLNIFPSCQYGKNK